MVTDNPTLSCPLSWILRRKCWGLGKGFGASRALVEPSSGLYLQPLDLDHQQSFLCVQVMTLGGNCFYFSLTDPLREF